LNVGCYGNKENAYDWGLLWNPKSVKVWAVMAALKTCICWLLGQLWMDIDGLMIKNYVCDIDDVCQKF